MRPFFRKYRNLLIILLVVVIAASAFLFVRRSNAGTASEFQTAAAERGTLTATIGATGTVRAKQTAVLVWQAAGTVDTVNVKVGDNLPEDFVIAFLKKSSLPQSVIMAEADLADAQQALDELLTSDKDRAEAVITLRDAQEAFTKADNYLHYLENSRRIPQTSVRTYLVRTPRGFEYRTKTKSFKGPAPEDWIIEAENDLALKKAELEEAQRTYDRLTAGNKAEIAAAQARVDAAEATLNLARVISPFAGTVTESHALSGDQVGAGDTAFRVDDLSTLLVDVKVSEVDINNVSIGQPVTLTFDAILGKEYHGEIVEVTQAGTVEQGVVNFTVTAELTDPDSFVKPGMTAGVNIVVEELQDVLLIPNRAVRLVDGERVVYVLEEGQPVKKEVNLGSSSDTMSAVTGGDVSEGDLIVLNPPVEFGPGGPGGF
ncbi:MAG TPA: efflux RND transporter periplasmic adaptor subunit [Anaerolineales bacterium]|nr:efflux RND transporter periplasmic adaptor subunit [Anaerolineales bacterium]